MKPLTCAVACAFVLLPALAPLAAFAQSYPSKPIRVVSDSASGSPGDVALRLVSQKMSVSLGQPVIVEPRTGAGGQIAANEVNRTGAEGYTILYSSVQIMASKFVLKNMRIDVETDLTPISMAARSNNFLVVHKSVPVSTMKEFLEYAKNNPGKITFSTNGIGSSLHLQWEGVMHSAGINLMHVPYGAGNNSLRLTDFFVGRTMAVMTPYGSMTKQMDSGDVKVLAMMGDERSAHMPDIPAISEVIRNAKIPTGGWGYWGAKGLAQQIVQRLATEIQRGFRDPEVAARLVSLDIKAAPSTPQEFAAFVSAQIAMLKELAAAAGITPQ
jgi:tripartite-type tricarboxylate transporter receptor subunit TctC